MYTQVQGIGVYSFEVEAFPWLPNFYYLPPDVRIASTKAYQEAKVMNEALMDDDIATWMLL